MIIDFPLDVTSSRLPSAIASRLVPLRFPAPLCRSLFLRPTRELTTARGHLWALSLTVS